LNLPLWRVINSRNEYILSLNRINLILTLTLSLTLTLTPNLTLFCLSEQDIHGTIDWYEFTSGLAVLCRGNRSERLNLAFDVMGEDPDPNSNPNLRLNLAFDMMDEDGDGMLTRGEITGFLTVIGGGAHGREMAEGLLKACGHNERLSKNEFLRSQESQVVLSWVDGFTTEFETRLRTFKTEESAEP